MTTKFELQQHVNRLTADNLALREKLSVLSTENTFLREKLAERDHLARRLIGANNRAVNASPRRKAMDAAKAEAKRLGTTVKAGGNHV